MRTPALAALLLAACGGAPPPPQPIVASAAAPEPAPPMSPDDPLAMRGPYASLDDFCAQIAIVQDCRLDADYARVAEAPAPWRDVRLFGVSPKDAGHEAECVIAVADRRGWYVWPTGRPCDEDMFVDVDAASIAVEGGAVVATVTASFRSRAYDDVVGRSMWVDGGCTTMRVTCRRGQRGPRCDQPVDADC